MDGVKKQTVEDKTNTIHIPEPGSQTAPSESIDKVAIYRAVLRALVHLEQKDYTEDRQADVRKHDDLPDPASACDTSQG